MKPIIFHRDAKQETRDVALAYEATGDDLATDFRTELDAALARIRANPQMYAADSRQARTAPLHRFPYSIVYKEYTDYIWVAAFPHHRRKPGYWRRRKP